MGERTGAVEARVLELLERTGALRTGHFRLSSGKHSDRYCQCAAVLERPEHARELATLMRERVAGWSADVVLAPALGGVVWGFALATGLGVRSIFAERRGGGALELRRGFAVGRGERVLLAEDVVTTGGSVMELAPIVEGAGAEVVGVASIVDRSGGSFDPGVAFARLVGLEFGTWDEAACPMCAAGESLDAPGSRASASSIGGEA